MLQNKKGFTLLELLVVIGIMVLLVGMFTIYFTNAQKKTRDAKRKEDLRQIAQALELYKDDVIPHVYPTLVGCATPVVNSTTNVTYMKKMPCDTANPTPFAYHFVPDNAAIPPTYELYACLESPGSTDTESCPVAYAASCTNIGASKCHKLTEPN